MGFCFGSLPFLLQEANATYHQIGLFSAASYPFSLKLLWAPIIDSVWNRRFGRRKSWIVPSQLLIGVSMLYIASMIDGWLALPAGGSGGSSGGSSSGGRSGVGIGVGDSIWTLTVWFGLVMLFASAQDIAVDGWSVTLLSNENQSYGSMCQSVGQSFGYALSYSAYFTLIHNPQFANRFWRSTPSDEPVVSLSNYILFWGIAYIVMTTVLALLKRETPSSSTVATPTSTTSVVDKNSAVAAEEAQEEEVSGIAEVRSTYSKVWRLVTKLPRKWVWWVGAVGSGSAFDLSTESLLL